MTNKAPAYPVAKHEMIRQSRRERLEAELARARLVIDVQTSLYCAFGFDLMREHPEVGEKMLKMLEEVENELEKIGTQRGPSLRGVQNPSEDQLRSAL